ncbi:MAG: RdgB/HAM1 family non-canonical purine NTP pyrophosphatase [Oscillospiraceae bacterium]|jgi:XTP/dITP diphosphohydrolase|nr:RdgB/HAM1 family non-canonical purine NTP pyrophosphatase [Oscillospiraceae bacterium]
MKIVLASRNKGKAREIADILGDGFEIVTLDDLGFLDEIEETGATFEENAAIKAETVCRACNIPAIADDSGLEVDALGGQPGIYSARFAKLHGYDKGGKALVLKLLEGVPAPRTARFVCAAAFAVPNGGTVVARGECDGAIGFKPEGTGGFGYDPIFLYAGRSMAAMSAAEKNAVSHRAAAFRKLAQNITNYHFSE